MTDNNDGSDGYRDLRRTIKLRSILMISHWCCEVDNGKIFKEKPDDDKTRTIVEEGSQISRMES